MDVQDSVTIGAAVTALVQLVKWGLAKRDPDGSYGPVLVAVLAALGVALWALSQPTLPTRLDAWGLFAAWIAVMLAAAGVYNFVRTVGTPVVNAVAGRIEAAKG
jgi:hypothetical protein